MRIYRQTDLVETVWKNGGGITRNIAAEMAGDATIWRLSMADVSTDGPFSSFPGLTRILTVIHGGGMILHADSGDLLAAYAKPVTFDGATAIVAELTEGPLRDFNLMFDPRRCDGEAHVKHGPLQTGVLGGAIETAVLHCITGVTRANDQTLMAGDTAIAQNAPIHYSLPDTAIALVITLRRLDQIETRNT